MPNNEIGDTIVVSYLGYEDKIFVISNEIIVAIKLTPSVGILKEVVVTAESDYLYEMIAKLRKNFSKKYCSINVFYGLEYYHCRNDDLDLSKCES